MTRHRVPVYGTVDKRIEVEHGATKGATIGKDLYNADGTLVSAGDIALSSTVIQQIVNQVVNQGGGGPSSTSELPEGSNLYYTTERVQDDVAAMFAGGTHTNVTVTYDDTTGSLSIAIVDGPGSGLDADTLDGQHGAYYLDYANFTGTPPSSGGGDSNIIAIAQAAHGLVVGQAIQLENALWVKSDADFDDKSADAFVSAVTDANNFVAKFAGPLTLTTAQWDAVTGQTGGLTPGEYYWLSNTPGAITSSNPVLVLRQCLGVAMNTTTLLVRIGEVFDGGGVPTPLPPIPPNTVMVSAGATTGVGGTGATMFVPLPTTYEVDDYFLMYAYTNNTSYGIGTPSGGWTLLSDMQNPGGSGHIAQLYGRRVRYAQEEIPRISFSAPNNTNCIGQMFAVRDVDLANPLRASGTTFSSMSTANIGPILPVVNGANDLIVVIGARCDNATSVDPLAGDGLTWAEIGERQTDSTTDCCYVWDCAPTTGTPVLTAKTFTVYGGTAERALGRMFAITAKSSTALDRYSGFNTSLCHFNGTNGATTTTDVVAGRTWTFSGGAVIDTSQFKFGVSSLRIPLTSSYAAASPGNLIPAGSEWTIDVWVRMNTVGGEQTIYSQYNQSSAVRTAFRFTGGKLGIFNGDQGEAIGTTVVTPGSWNHVRIVRESATVCKGYLNGVLECVHQNFLTPYAGSGILGAYIFSSAPMGMLDGWIDEFRVTNGIARVRSPHTALLLNFDGADASTTITDSSTHPSPAWTASGNAQLDTAKFKFGTASLLLDGANDWISTADSPRVDPGIRDYTMAGWIWVNAWQANTASIISNIIFNGSGYPHYGHRMYYSADGSAGFTHYYNSNSGVTASGPAGTLTLGAWIHLAACRQGPTLRFYVNGVQTSTTGAPGPWPMQTGTLRLTMGYAMDANDTTPAPAGYGVNGWLDGWEFVIGEAMYPDGTTFTPPVTAPVPRGIGNSYFALPTAEYPDS